MLYFQLIQLKGEEVVQTKMSLKYVLFFKGGVGGLSRSKSVESLFIYP